MFRNQFVSLILGYPFLAETVIAEREPLTTEILLEITDQNDMDYFCYLSDFSVTLEKEFQDGMFWFKLKKTNAMLIRCLSCVNIYSAHR